MLMCDEPSQNTFLALGKFAVRQPICRKFPRDVLQRVLGKNFFPQLCKFCMYGQCRIPQQVLSSFPSICLPNEVNYDRRFSTWSHCLCVRIWHANGGRFTLFSPPLSVVITSPLVCLRPLPDSSASPFRFDKRLRERVRVSRRRGWASCVPRPLS